jgi:CRP/FNR family transcriptional regulator
VAVAPLPKARKEADHLAVQSILSQPDLTSIVPAFRELPPEERRAVSDILSVRRYRKESYIFIEGEDSEFVSFVLDGAIRTFRTSADGQEQTLRMVRPGDVLALSGLFGAEPYVASAEASEASTVAFIQTRALRALIQRHAAVGWAFLQIYGQRLREAQEQMAELSGRDASQKLAAALLRLGEESGVPDGRAIFVPQHFTHRQLAQLIGCSRETVTRVLREFRQDRSVDLDPDGHLRIDPDRLQRHIA